METMSKTLTDNGTYKAPNGDLVTYSFDYLVIDSIADAVNSIGEVKVVSNVQRMLKLDANNISREKAKVANGHSSRKPMSEEEKAQAKVERQANKALLDIIKSKGLKLEDLADL